MIQPVPAPTTPNKGINKGGKEGWKVNSEQEGPRAGQARLGLGAGSFTGTDKPLPRSQDHSQPRVDLAALTLVPSGARSTRAAHADKKGRRKGTGPATALRLLWDTELRICSRPGKRHVSHQAKRAWCDSAPSSTAGQSRRDRRGSP